jgi:iron(III) transport system substrate-binding protein
MNSLLTGIFRKFTWRILSVLAVLIVLLPACSPSAGRSQVVVYVTVDQVYAEPILKEFEAQSGIQVLAVYDIEATKTTGLVNRLLAEKDRPQADVFWSNEFSQTLLLKGKGVLAPFKPENAAGLPPTLVDAGGYWTGFGGRARVLLINTQRIDPSQAPQSILDLTRGIPPASQVGIALPMFGTAATHAAALYAAIGSEKAGNYYRQIAASEVRVLDGNSVVRDLVVNGELSAGMTDTDDACVAIQKGEAVQMVFLDQQTGGLGTLLIPNTVALIQAGPHPGQGKQLIEYLVSPAVEGKLLQAGSIQVAARPIQVQNPCAIPSGIRWMAVDYEKVYQSLQPAQDELRQVFIQ